jgi:hypothetical protein
MTSTTLPSLDDHRPVDAATVTAFRAAGHALVRGLADADEVAAHRTVISDAVRRRSTETRPLAERDTYGRAFLQVPNLWRHDRGVARFVLAERFAGAAADLLGVDAVRIYHDQALYKEPGGGRTPWHQDGVYWPLDTDLTITMWMPLVDVAPRRAGWSSRRARTAAARSPSTSSPTTPTRTSPRCSPGAASRWSARARCGPATRASTPGGRCTAPCPTAATPCARS